jgi:hypothetical protein
MKAKSGGDFLQSDSRNACIGKLPGMAMKNSCLSGGNSKSQNAKRQKKHRNQKRDI